MSVATLRVPRQAPLASPPAWFKMVEAPTGFLGADITCCSAYYNNKTYIAYVTPAGSAVVSSFDHTTKEVLTSSAVVTGLGADIHATPSLLVRSSDKKLVLVAIPHNSTHVYVAISTNAEDISSWGSATDIGTTIGGTSHAYARLVQLSGESGKMYLFFRDRQDTDATNVLCYSTSSDGGSTWTAQTELYKNSLHQAYWVIGSDDANRIDIATSDGTVSAGDTSASVYHFYYDATATKFKTSDGTEITDTKPFTPSSLTKLYDGATNGSASGPNCMIPGTTPIVAFGAASSTSGDDSNFWYSIYTSGAWSTQLVDSTGTSSEVNFGQVSGGGIAVDRIDNSKAYVSKKVSGIWQMFLYVTADQGATWTSTQLTFDVGGQDADRPNIMPCTPHNAATELRCIWCFGPHYLEGSLETSSAAIRGYPNPVAAF